MTATGLRIPITNILGAGGYSAPIMIGGTGVTANVLLDTASSTLAVHAATYDPDTDTNMRPMIHRASTHRLGIG